MEGKTQTIEAMSAKPSDQRVQDYLRESKILSESCDEQQRRLILSKLLATFGRSHRIPAADRSLILGTAQLVYKGECDGAYSEFGDYRVSKPYDESLDQDQEPFPKKRLLGFHDGSSLKTEDEPPRDNIGFADVFYINIRADAYAVKRNFLSLWRNGNPLTDKDLKNHIEKKKLERKEPRFATCTRWVNWDDDDLYMTENTPNLQRSHRAGFLPPNGRRFRAHRRISSQLLVYRLTAIFGMPPSSEMDYVVAHKSIWRCTLFWLDDVQNENLTRDYISQVYFEDNKGLWTVTFDGIEVASESAVQLIDWLCGDNVPHPYDYVVAGAIS